MEYAPELLKNTSDEELNPLLSAHWEEVGSKACPCASLSFNRELHIRLEGVGAWRAFSARENGILKGYVAFFISPHPFISELTATLEVLYLVPSKRQGLIVLDFLRYAFENLKKEGVNAVHCGSPSIRDCGALFKRLGARHIETIWRKEL